MFGGLQHIAALHLQHAVILPGADVVGVRGERLLVPVFGRVIVAELAAGIAQIVRDVRTVVVIEGVQRDAVLVDGVYEDVVCMAVVF